MKENAKTFIISKLSQLVIDISELRILYKFDAFNKDHLIKVLPKNEYQKNTNYHEFEEVLIFDFIDKYPYDNLVFLSEDDSIDIENYDEEFLGKEYELKNIISKLKETIVPEFYVNELFSVSDIKDDMFNISEILESYSNFKLEFPQPIIKDYSIKDEYFGLIEVSDSCIFNEKDPSYVHENEMSNSIEDDPSCDCDNFALAA